MSARDPIPDDRFSPDDRSPTLRVPPHAAESEHAVLGALLLDNRLWDIVGDLLTDADFYRFENKLAFTAIGHMVNANRPADVITVHQHLQDRGKGSEVSLQYLNAMAQALPSGGAVRRHAEIVREKAQLRRLISACDEIATRAFNTNGESVAAIVDEAEAKILAVAEGAGSAEGFQSMEVFTVQALDRIQRIHDNPDEFSDFIPTGIGAWDDLMDGGMRGGELHIVGARPGMGKSATLLTVATNVVRFKRAGVHVGEVGIFSMEMPGLQWANRAIAQVGRVHLSKIKRPERLRDEDWPGIREGVDLLGAMGLHIDARPGLTINALRSEARKLARRVKLALLGVDYLGLMRGLDPKMSRAYQIEEITQGLKNLAKELGVPVMLLVQLRRAVDSKGDQIDALPSLGDLRDSGAIEQDADTITFVHRPKKAVPDLSDEWAPYAKGFVAKARDSEGGIFHMHYDGPRLQFADWPTGLEVPRSRVRVAGSTTSNRKEL